MTCTQHAGLNGGSAPAGNPRPLSGYALLLTVYGAFAGSLMIGLRRKKAQVRLPKGFDLVLLGLATEHLSRLVTKDSITGVLRSPFTRFEEPAGEGEVDEKVTGTGIPRAIGELLTCPFCVAQWIATTLVAGQIAVPRFTTAVVSISAVARVSDYLQLSYGILREQQ